MYPLLNKCCGQMCIFRGLNSSGTLGITKFEKITFSNIKKKKK